MPEEATQYSRETFPDGRLMVRKACLKDAGAMHQIINYYAESQVMLPKTMLQLYENLRDYSVVVAADDQARVVGCGALHIYWENLAEIRAVAVAPEMTGKGVGTVLIDRLLEEARELKIERVFVFTYEPRFFGRFGFVQVEHSAMPLKVYNECFNCPKFNKCDEIAMVLDL
ncbi:MAG TPA: N-acetyltransferase [Acidobacteriota bacterium]|nr:N-acetyltransferase [Acidobacteriota bacterium]